MRKHIAVTKKGSALYVAVMMVSILLIMASNVATIAFKQLQFSTYAAQSKKAFFAADTGLECAQYLDFAKDSTKSQFPLNNTPAEMIKLDNGHTCLDHPIGVVGGPSNGTSAITTIYVHFSTTGTSDPCAEVTISKTLVGANIRTNITANGYDTADNTALNSCASTGQSRRVQRTLVASY